MKHFELSWEDLRLFLVVYETGSFSGAARRLRLGQPTLSRRIGHLERQIGEALFSRLATGVVPSPTAERLLPAIQRMADLAAEAAQGLESGGTEPAGRVRIAAPPAAALDFLAPFALELRQRYPLLRLEILSSVDFVNLARGEADLSIRTLLSDDPDLICLDELRVRMGVYVAPSYAAKLRPRAKLKDLDWIAWPSGFEYQRVQQELTRRIPDFQAVFTSDDYNVQCAACEAGVGAMILPAIAHRYSRSSRLVKLDIDLGVDAVGSLFLVCHKRQRHLPKVQAVADRIKAVFENVRKSSPVTRSGGG